MIAKGLTWSVIAIAAMLAGSAYAWNMLLADIQFPVQWKTTGEVNRYADKMEALLGVPKITAIIAIALAIAPLIDPRRKNLEQSSGFYLAAWLGGLMIALLAHFTILYSALTGETPSVKAFFIVNGLFFILLGNFMAKSKSNWFAGVRTPWTLSSEHAWSVANRLGGAGFVVTGLATIVSAVLFETGKTLAVMLAGLAATIIVSVVASYLAWRHDPDRNARADEGMS